MSSSAVHLLLCPIARSMLGSKVLHHLSRHCDFVRLRTSAPTAAQLVLYSLPRFFLEVFVIALVSLASSSNVQRRIGRVTMVARAFGCVSVTGSAFVFVSSLSAQSATGGGSRVFRILCRLSLPRPCDRGSKPQETVSLFSFVRYFGARTELFCCPRQWNISMLLCFKNESSL
jgi:hypothetical protein